jgi:hypothetical protein
VVSSSTASSPAHLCCRWKDSASQLALLAKDVGRVSVFATEYVVDKQNLALLMSDERQNLQVRLSAYTTHRTRRTAHAAHTDVALTVRVLWLCVWG